MTTCVAAAGGGGFGLSDVVFWHVNLARRVRHGVTTFRSTCWKLLRGIKFRKEACRQMNRNLGHRAERHARSLFSSATAKTCTEWV
ncbi:unnamed protein product [Lampetra planeri]